MMPSYLPTRAHHCFPLNSFLTALLIVPSALLTVALALTFQQIPISKWLLQEQEADARLVALQQQLKELDDDGGGPGGGGTGPVRCSHDDDRIFSDDEDDSGAGGGRAAGSSGAAVGPGSAAAQAGLSQDDVARLAAIGER